MTAVARYRISAEDDSTRTLRKVRKGYADLRGEIGAVSSSYRGLQSAAGALTLGFVGGNITEDVQELQDSMARLSILSTDFASDQQFLQQTSQALSADYLALSNSYGKFLNLQKSGLVTQAEARQLMIGLTETSKAYGASSGQVENVMYGLAQALGQGQLQAQELNQVVEPLPGLLNNIAAEAGTTGIEFRNMVKDGKVTSDTFKQLLIPALEKYAGTAEAMKDTVRSSFTATANEYTLLVQDLEQPLGGGLTSGAQAITAALHGVRENLDVIEDVAKSAAIALGVLAVAKGAAALASSQLAVAVGTSNAVFLAGSPMLAAYTLRAGLAATATRGLAVSTALLGGPYGVATIAVAGLAYGYLQLTAEERNYTEVAELARKATEQLTEAKGPAEKGALDHARAAEKETAALLETAEAQLLLAEQQARLDEGTRGSFIEENQANIAREHVEELREALDKLKGSIQDTVSDNALIDMVNNMGVGADEAKKASKELQQTLDRLFPKQAIQRKFEVELALINKSQDALSGAGGLDAAVTALERDRDAALARLSKPTGSKANPLGDLLDDLYPDRKLTAEFELDLKLLKTSLDAGQIDGGQYSDAVSRLRTQLVGELDALKTDTEQGLTAFDQMVEQFWPERRLTREYEVQVALLDANRAELAPGEYAALFSDIKKEMDDGMASLIESSRPAGDILDRLFPQERLSKDFAADVRELNTAFGNNQGSAQHAEAIRRITTEYELAKRQLGENGLDPAVLDPFYTKAFDKNEQLKSSFTNLSEATKQLWGDALDDNEDAFGNFVDAIQAEMEEMIYQQYIAEAANGLAATITQGLGSLFTAGTPTAKQAQATQKSNNAAFQTGTPLANLPAYSGGNTNITIAQDFRGSSGTSRSAMKSSGRAAAKQAAASVAQVKARGGAAARAL